MTKKKFELIWVPLENADPSPVAFRLDAESGRLIYKLPANLPFGHLEVDGIDVTGYFQPFDDEVEFVLRPWLV